MTTDWGDHIDDLRGGYGDRPDDINNPEHPLHALRNARVVFWTCPLRHPRSERPRPTVEWETVDGKMIPHCLICGETGAPR